MFSFTGHKHVSLEYKPFAVKERNRVQGAGFKNINWEEIRV
jgi:hypothetical protein